MTNSDPAQIRAGIWARVQRRLKATQMKPRSASLEAKLGPDAIRDIARKTHSLPRIDTIVSLAPVLGTSPEWLAFGAGPEEPTDLTPQTVAIPLVSWVAASRFAESASSEFVDESDYIWVADMKPGRYIALRVVGDSMNLIAPDEAVIIVDVDDKDLRPRQFYVFSDREQATFKRYMINPKRLEPHSTNPAHEPIEPTRSTAVVGRVVKVMTDV